MIYTDGGPIAKSNVFKRVLHDIGVDLRIHVPKGKDGRRKTTRSKGKVERPFRTVKELHETLYHFRTPKDVDEANAWLLNFILRYNERDHRTEQHSRIEDWIKNLPTTGIREICTWERFATFAREPERRKVASDATIKINGGLYRVDPSFAGHNVILWWGLFDTELFIEHDGKKSGPFYPDEGPIPLNQFRRMKKTKAEKRADSIEKLSDEIVLPIEALTEDTRTSEALKRCLAEGTAIIRFKDPDPFHELAYRSIIEAKIAVASDLGIPLSKLSAEDKLKIDEILSNTLTKKDVLSQIRKYFRQQRKGGNNVK